MLLMVMLIHLFNALLLRGGPFQFSIRTETHFPIARRYNGTPLSRVALAARLCRCVLLAPLLTLLLLLLLLLII